MLVKISRTAQNRLEAYFSEISEKSKQAGEKFILEFRDRIRDLEQFPEIGKEFRKATGTRVLLITNYRIFYRINKDSILVTFMQHTKQKPIK